MLSTTFTMGQVMAIYHFVVIDSTGTLGRCETVEKFAFGFAQIDCALGRIYRSFLLIDFAIECCISFFYFCIITSR